VVQICGAGLGDHHHIQIANQLGTVMPEELPDMPFHPVPVVGLARLPRYHQTEAALVCRAAGHNHPKMRGLATPTLAERAVELSSLAYAAFLA
jgi:hypothetical protein